MESYYTIKANNKQKKENRLTIPIPTDDDNESYVHTQEAYDFLYFRYRAEPAIEFINKLFRHILGIEDNPFA